MSKVRLYHLARDWELSERSVLDALHEAGRRLKSHYVEIEAHEVEGIRAILTDAGLFGPPEGEEVSEAAPEGEGHDGGASHDDAEAPAAEAPAEAVEAPEAEAPAAPEAEAPAAEAPAAEAPAAETSEVADAPEADAKANSKADDPKANAPEADAKASSKKSSKKNAKADDPKADAKAASPAAKKDDAPKATEPKATEPKAGATKKDAPKAASPAAKKDAPKTGAPKAGAPKAGAPKTGAPKAGAPKAGAPKAGAPKAKPPANKISPTARGKAAANKDLPADAPQGVAAGFTGFAPGFDPNQHRRGPRRAGGGPGRGPAGGGGSGAPGQPPGLGTSRSELIGDRRRAFSNNTRTAVSPAKRGRQTTRRTGGQAQMGRGRRLERRMVEREHWKRAKKTQRRSSKSTSHIVRPDHAEIQMPISLKDLSSELAIRIPEIMGFLMKKGIMINQNAPVPKDVIQEIGERYSIIVDVLDERDVENQLEEIVEYEDDDQDLETRQPIVAVLGHVDHGKTSLLDRIRSTKAPVTDQEAGGITQHIGAYVAEHNDKKVTFIDTPGHEAFTEMRARGANLTDVVLLVIAADDGVMPQTKEAIQHAQAADAQIVVAMNKIDKNNANPDKVLQQLSQIDGMLPVDYGGEIEVIPVSAITGEGIDDLMETLLTLAEILDLKANPNKPAFGTVLEAKKSEGRGNVVSVIVQDGTIRRADAVLASRGAGKVRMLFNDRNLPIKEAGPGTPVEILGLDDLPEPGDQFFVLEKNEDLRAIVAKREAELRARTLTGPNIPTDVDGIYATLAKAEVKEVNVVLKADVQGTLQVLKREISKLGNEEVRARILLDGVGGITTADVMLASASSKGNAVVVGFGVGVDTKARALARERDVQIRSHNVIYELLNEVKDLLAGALDPEEREEILGQVEIRKVYKSSKLGNIGGCFVEEGVVRRNAHARLVRDGIVHWQGELDSLRRFADSVNEVRENFECGIKLKNYDDIKEGDHLEIFEIHKIARTLD